MYKNGETYLLNYSELDHGRAMCSECRTPMEAEIHNQVFSCATCRKEIKAAAITNLPESWQKCFASTEQENLDQVKDMIDTLVAKGCVREARELSHVVIANSGPSIPTVRANDRLAIRLLYQAEIVAENTKLRARLALLRHQIEKEIWAKV